jgi:hypothetical protein
MIYVQHKSKQKLHLAYELEDGLTQPICGKKFNNYRATFNVSLGNACKNCQRRLNSKLFDHNKFIGKYYKC